MDLGQSEEERDRWKNEEHEEDPFVQRSMEVLPPVVSNLVKSYDNMFGNSLVQEEEQMVQRLQHRASSDSSEQSGASPRGT